MKKAYKILSLSVVTLLFISFSSSHPVGRTGAPGDGLCSDCHGGSASFGGSVNLLGLPSTVIPGQVYDITIELDASSGSPVRGGFQVVALRDQNDTQAGSWSNPDNSSSLKTSSGRVYFGHEPFRSFGAGTMVSWEAQWEAPNITDDISFYMAGNLANGNGSSSGDEIVTNQLTVESTAINILDVQFENIQAVSCAGDSDGEATAVVSGGVPPYEYAWDNGEENSSATMLDGGLHSLTVTDDNGTMITENVSIPEPSEIEADINIIDVSCFGERDGEIEVEAFGGTGALECNWFSLGVGCLQDGLEAEIYFLTITDENNCIFETEVELFEPEELELAMSSTDASPLNNDGTASCIPSGGTSPYRFAWSNGAIETGLSSMITGLSQGEFSVTVVDGNGCDENATVTVGGVSCAIDLSLSTMNIQCYGDSTGIITSEVFNATAPVSYQWSDASTATSLENLPAGFYSLTVTDANACSASAMAQIIQPDSLYIDSLSIIDNACQDDIGASISFVLKGGTAPYNLFWSNGETNDTLINGLDTLINIPDTLTQLNTGVYILSITDANNCVRVDSFNIETIDNEPPLVEINSLNWFLTIDGTSLPLLLSDLDAMITDNCAVDSISYIPSVFDCTDIGLQTLEIEVFDSNGNATTEQFVVNVSDLVLPQIECNNSDVNISTCDEIIYQSPTASDNCMLESLDQIAGQPSGTIFPDGTTVNTFLATDESGNTASCSFSITVDSNLSVDIVTMDATCAGDDGSITVDVSGGSPPYSISPNELDGLSAGTYNLLITDASGCFYEEELLVGQELAEFTFSISITNVSCKGGDDGAIEVIVDFIDTTQTYTLFVDGVQSGFDNLAAGEHILTIEEISSSCEITEIFTINEPDEELMQDIVDYELDPCTMLLLDSERAVTGGTPPYVFDEEQTGTQIIFSVSDANGCVESSIIEANIPDEILFVSVQNIMDADNGSNGSISVQAGGGVPPYSYIWFDESGNEIGTGSTLGDLDPGVYSLIVSDAAGCVLAPSSFNIDMISGIKNIESQNIVRISPNPAREFITIDYGNAKPDFLSIVSIDGTKVLELEPLPLEERVDISKLEDGIYLVRVAYGNSIEIIRIVKY